MRLEEGMMAGDEGWMAKIPHEELVIGNVPKGLVFDVDPKAVGRPWVICWVSFDADVAHFNGLPIS